MIKEWADDLAEDDDKITALLAIVEVAETSLYQGTKDGGVFWREKAEYMKWNNGFGVSQHFLRSSQ
jgi:hypothetical protein